MTCDFLKIVCKIVCAHLSVLVIEMLARLQVLFKYMQLGLLKKLFKIYKTGYLFLMDSFYSFNTVNIRLVILNRNQMVGSTPQLASHEKKIELLIRYSNNE